MTRSRLPADRAISAMRLAPRLRVSSGIGSRIHSAQYAGVSQYGRPDVDEPSADVPCEPASTPLPFSGARLTSANDKRCARTSMGFDTKMTADGLLGDRPPSIRP